jgi:putative endonuclease
MADWFLYLIRCRQGSLYAGITTDVERRFLEHQGHGGTGSKYLKGRAPLTLVFSKNLGDKSLALKVEHQVKGLSRVNKERFINAPGYVEEIISRSSKSNTRES